jgi:hypothetical protein
MSTVHARRSDPITEPARAKQVDNPVARFRPDELHRLLRLRYGRTLPADDNGRRAAARMVDALAMSGDDGRRRAANFLELWCPWMALAERVDAIEAAFRSPRFWSSRALGDELGLTWLEREAARITTFRPAGASDADMAERRKMREAARKREKRRQTTLHPKEELPLPAIRAEVIASILRPGERCAVNAICEELKRTRHIRFAHLEGKALATAVHNAIDYGTAEGFLRKDVEPGRRMKVAWVTKVGAAP